MTLTLFLPSLVTSKAVLSLQRCVGGEGVQMKRCAVCFLRVRRQNGSIGCKPSANARTACWDVEPGTKVQWKGPCKPNAIWVFCKENRKIFKCRDNSRGGCLQMACFVVETACKPCGVVVTLARIGKQVWRLSRTKKLSLHSEQL